MTKKDPEKREISARFLTTPSRPPMNSQESEPSISDVGPATHQAHSQQGLALQFQPEGQVLGACTKIQENTFPGDSPDPALPDWLQTAKAVLSPAGQQPNSEANHPPQRHTSPCKVLNRSSEFIRILKVPFILAVHTVMKSQTFYFCSYLLWLISPPPRDSSNCTVYANESIFMWNSRNTETTIISDFRLGLV